MGNGIIPSYRKPLETQKLLMLADLACTLLIGLVSLAAFGDAVAPQGTSSGTPPATPGTVPQSDFFVHPPKAPFSADDYVFKLDQLPHLHRSPGEFVHVLEG